MDCFHCVMLEQKILSRFHTKKPRANVSAPALTVLTIAAR